MRTRMNVEDSHGTLILTWGPPVGGTALTLKLARRVHKPSFVVDLLQGGNASSVLEWAQANDIRILNVACAREKLLESMPGLFFSSEKNRVSYSSGASP